MLTSQTEMMPTVSICWVLLSVLSKYNSRFLCALRFSHEMGTDISERTMLGDVVQLVQSYREGGGWGGVWARGTGLLTRAQGLCHLWNLKWTSVRFNMLLICPQWICSLLCMLFGVDVSCPLMPSEESVIMSFLIQPTSEAKLQFLMKLYCSVSQVTGVRELS